MAKVSFVVAGVVPVLILAVACGSSDPPPATPIAPATGTAPAGATAYPPGYQQPGYQQPGYTPTGPTAPAAGQMATPGPTALACQNDSQCMTHRCNMQYQKCAFPCLTDIDCVQGTTCFVAGGPAAICVPKPPGSP